MKAFVDELQSAHNDNRVEPRGNNRVAAVKLATNIAIVNANRVRGGKPSIEVTGAKSAAVLGNITTGDIIAIPDGLQPQWDALNLRA